MSAPLGSQPQFSISLPGPPLMAQPPAAAAVSYASSGLMPPVQGAFPRPMPHPMLPISRPQTQGLRGGPTSPLTLNPPRDGKAMPSIMPPKQTTLYVGKIAPSISDSLVKELLEACGPVKSWKRMEDPDTKALKAFGFCEFEEADGVIQALSLLQNLSIGGQELLLKCNTGTQRYIDEMEARKAMGGAPVGEASDPEEAPKPSTADGDNAALEKVMSLVSKHAESLPPPPEAVTAADNFLSSLKQDTEKGGRDRHPRDRGRSRRDSREGADDEKALEANFHRERESERKEQEARLHEQDQVYKTALRKWEVQEMDVRKNLERERDRERDIMKERRRQLRADLEADNESEEIYQRKLYADSRRATDRKRWREKECHEDEADSLKEEEELAKRPKLQESREMNGQNRSPSGAGSPVQDQPPLQSQYLDPDDKITRAMMTAAKAPRKQAAAASPQQLSTQISEPLSTTQEPAAAQPKPIKPVVLAAFGGDEEEDQPKRMLKPLTYTEEEQKASQRVAAPSLKEKQAAVKELIAKVPTEIKEVFSYSIDWKAYDEGGPALKERIQKWVSRKTGELLGLEELSMVEFIMNLLAEHTPAKKVLEHLQEVLDEETNPFVFKLFRMVIFETLKQAANLQD